MSRTSRPAFAACCLTPVFAFALAGLASAAASAPAPASLDAIHAQRIDALFADVAKPDMPGCALAVYRDGAIAYSRGYGLADLEHGIAIDPARTVFNIGSTSKQFTAASLLLLVQEGRLKLDDDVRRYVPELPDYGHVITIDHLLHHTSGLRDYLMLMGLGSVHPEDYVSDDDVMRMVARQRALDFVPGTRYSYSNTGYFLLARIVERTSGQSFREFAQQRLFEPLGMRDTRFVDDHQSIVRGRAESYEVRPDGSFARSVENWEDDGPGSLHTTVADLARWDRNFQSPTVGGKALIEALEQRGTLDDGTPIGYARGLFVEDRRGEPMIAHAGAQTGYRAELVRLPRRRLSVAVLCNFDESDPAALARRTLDVLLDEDAGARAEATPASATPVADTPAPAAEAATPVANPQRFAGLYWSADASLLRRVEVVDGHVFYVRSATNRSELVPQDAHRLVMRGVATPTELRIDGEPGRRRLRLDNGDGRPTEFVEVQPFVPGTEAVRAFAGRYRSDELDNEWVLASEGALLFLRQPRHAPQVLKPVFADTFQFESLFFRFERDDAGRVVALVVDTPRARGLRFVRTGD